MLGWQVPKVTALIGRRTIKFEARLIYLVRSKLGKTTEILFQKAKKKKSLIENKAL